MRRLPQKMAAVTLAVPQRERVPATVARTGDGWIDLLLQATPSTAPALLAHGGLFVEYFNDEGLCRLLARKGVGDEPEPVGGWGVGDVMRIDHDGAVQLLQARASIRADVVADIELISLETGARHRTTTTDLSGGGALLVSLPDARRGDAFEFELELPEHAIPVTGRLRVVSAALRERVAVEFTDLSLEDKTRVERFVVNVQSAARSARKVSAR
jgi:hypothetical protein